MVANANGAGVDPAHVDLTYAYNDKLSFTLGKVVDDGEFSDGEDTYAWNDEVKFVVALTLPIQ
jgi:hypothetical protein